MFLLSNESCFFSLSCLLSLNTAFDPDVSASGTKQHSLSSGHCSYKKPKIIELVDLLPTMLMVNNKDQDHIKLVV
ncbi:hypothetical protein QVD17_01392 [Tagetes erecta]|uniref:Uncharacterized protein n=1 Tax=Tagetes erecta TaxID=13708 RepID=A0AAD8LAJ9_TARER|nr:hypothetical protein QVD17_01392 [Tagetes erecta]